MYSESKKQRIGIIGAGMAGLAAGWSLKKSGFDVQIFEEKAVAGGHAAQVKAELDGVEKTFLNGNGIEPKNFFNIKAFTYEHGIHHDHFLAELDYYTQLSDGRKWYTNRAFWHHTDDEDRLLASKKQEWKKFISHATDLYARDHTVELSQMTIREFFSANHYSEYLSKWFLYPLMSNLYDMYNYDLFMNTAFVMVPAYLYNLDFGFTPYFGYATNLSLAHKLSELLSEEIYSATKILSVNRQGEEIQLKDEHGRLHEVDHVIFAIHPSSASGCIEDLSIQEKNVLGGISTYQYDVIIHRDNTLLPKDMQSEVFYFDEEKNLMLEDISWVEHCVRDKVFRSISEKSNNQLQYIDPKKIIDVSNFHRDYPGKDSFIAKGNLHQLQGYKNTWYAGSGTTLPFAEPCFCAGLAIAETLGAVYPFQGNTLAERSYLNTKNFMLSGTPMSLAQ